MKQYGDSWILGKPTQEGIYWVWDTSRDSAQIVKIKMSDKRPGSYLVCIKFGHTESYVLAYVLEHIKYFSHYQKIDPPQKPR